MTVSATEISECYASLPPSLRDTPLLRTAGIDRMAGGPIYLKLECVSPVGSFKTRGTYAFVRGLAARGDNPEIVCVTTGNFGLGIAYGCREFGLRASVFLPADANPVKRKKLTELGAKVECGPGDFFAAEQMSLRYAQEPGRLHASDGMLPEMRVGAGTIGVELMRDPRGPASGWDTIFVPVGDGSLIGGIGAWFKRNAPKTRIVGVQAKAAPAATMSWRTKRRLVQEPGPTIAEGIGTRELSQAAFHHLLELVDEMILVDEESIAAAQQDLERAIGITVEPASATVFAAALSVPATQRGMSALIITGSNKRPNA